MWPIISKPKNRASNGANGSASGCDSIVGNRLLLGDHLSFKEALEEDLGWGGRS